MKTKIKKEKVREIYCYHDENFIKVKVIAKNEDVNSYYPYLVKFPNGKIDSVSLSTLYWPLK